MGKNVIFHVHGAEYMTFYNELSETKRTKMLNIFKKADLVIALSQKWKDKFDITFGLNNCVVLENGINMERLEPAIIDPKLYQHFFWHWGVWESEKGLMREILEGGYGYLFDVGNNKKLAILLEQIISGKIENNLVENVYMHTIDLFSIDRMILCMKNAYYQ